MLTTIYIVEQLTNNLKSSDSLVRIHAATNLGLMASDARDAVPALIDLLVNGDIHDRKVAALTLGQIGPAAREAMSALFAAAADDHKDLAELAMTALDAIDRVDAGAGVTWATR